MFPQNFRVLNRNWIGAAHIQFLNENYGFYNAVKAENIYIDLLTSKNKTLRAQNITKYAE